MGGWSSGQSGLDHSSVSLAITTPSRCEMSNACFSPGMFEGETTVRRRTGRGERRGGEFGDRGPSRALEVKPGTWSSLGCPCEMGEQVESKSQNLSAKRLGVRLKFNEIVDASRSVAAVYQDSRRYRSSIGRVKGQVVGARPWVKSDRFKKGYCPCV